MLKAIHLLLKISIRWSINLLILKNRPFREHIDKKQSIPLAKSIADDKISNEDILEFIRTFDTRSPAFSAHYEEYSPLVWASIRASYTKSDVVMKALLKKLTSKQFIASFQSDSSDTSEKIVVLHQMFLPLLDWELSSFPSDIQPIIVDCRERQRAALLVSAEGLTSLHGLHWEVAGYHNYRVASDMLFQTLDRNSKEIIATLRKGIELTKLKGKINEIQKAVEESIALMRYLAFPNTVPSDFRIQPFLVGTTGSSGLHAEGFVIHGSRYLHIERSHPKASGITLYRKKKECNEKTLNKVLAKIEKSTDVVLKKPLSPDKFMSSLLDRCLETDTAVLGYRSDDVEPPPPDAHISMPKQGDKDCISASLEGIYLAILYAKFIEQNIFEPIVAKDKVEKDKLEKDTITNYVITIFNTNKTIEIGKFLDKLIEQCTTMDSSYLEELAGFLKIIEESLKHQKLLSEFIGKKFTEFRDRRTSTISHPSSSSAPASSSASTAGATIPPRPMVFTPPETFKDLEKEAQKLVMELSNTFKMCQESYRNLTEYLAANKDHGDAATREEYFKRFPNPGVDVKKMEEFFKEQITNHFSMKNIEALKGLIKELQDRLQLETTNQKQMDELLAHWKKGVEHIAKP